MGELGESETELAGLRGDPAGFDADLHHTADATDVAELVKNGTLLRQ
jgi:hypothetical protein